ncbi:MAG: hypothetical protein ABIK44_04565 [candidate division WOR-3 bacterium]
MKRIIVILILALAAALAQSGQRVLEELRQTDEVIDRAREVVEPSNNQEAKGLLGEAIQLQNQAWDNYHGRRYVRAHGLTMDARLKARNAAGMVQADPERIQAEIRRTDELFAFAGPLIKRAAEPRALELWRIAGSEQQSAKDEFGRRHYWLALKFTLAARLHVRTILNLLKAVIAPERVEAEIQRTAELTVRAQEAVQNSGNERARLLLQKALSLQEQARVSFRNRLYSQALRKTISARTILLRAWELATVAPVPTMVDQALKETDRLLETWAESIAQSDNPEAKGLLEQARIRQRSALEFHARNRLRLALAESNAAFRMIQRAIELIQAPEVPAETPEPED